MARADQVDAEVAPGKRNHEPIKTSEVEGLAIPWGAMREVNDAYDRWLERRGLPKGGWKNDQILLG